MHSPIPWLRNTIRTVNKVWAPCIHLFLLITFLASITQVHNTSKTTLCLLIYRRTGLHYSGQTPIPSGIPQLGTLSLIYPSPSFLFPSPSFIFLSLQCYSLYPLLCQLVPVHYVTNCSTTEYSSATICLTDRVWASSIGRSR